MWVLLYLMQHFIVGFGFGSLFYSLHLPINLNGKVRFLIGFCLAPFVMSYSASILGYIIPGGNLFWYRFFPLLIGLALSFIFGKGVLSHLVDRLFKLNLRNSLQQSLCLFFVIIISINLILTAINLGPLYDEPIKERDALVYLNEALAFTNERDSRNAILGIRDHPDGSIIGNYHGFVFTGYLSHALMFSNDPGPSEDFAVRIAFHILFIYGILSLIALGTALYNPNVGLFATILMFYVDRYSTILAKFSRDFFRIIPFIILVLILLRVDDDYLKKKNHSKADLTLYLVLWIYTVLSVTSHSVGVVFVICLALVWFLIRSWRGEVFQKKLTVLVLLALGTIIGGFRFVEVIIFSNDPGSDQNFLSLGSAGEEAFYDEEISDELSFESYMNLGIDERYAKFNTMKFGQLIKEILGRDKYLISVPSLAILGLLSVQLIRKKNSPSLKEQLFIGLVFLSCYIPFTGIFDISVYSISQLYFVNSRYLTHAYPFGAVLIALTLFKLLHTETGLEV